MRYATGNGASASKQFVLSMWVADDNPIGKIYYDESLTFSLSHNTLGAFAILARDASATLNLQVLFDSGSAGFGISGARIHHILISMDLADTAKRFIYVNDLNITARATWTTYTNSAIRFGFGSQSAVGSWADGTNNIFEGRLAEIYVCPGAYLDLSVEANRRKFIDRYGRPVNLGADGSAPTGVVPVVYQSAPRGGAASDFLTNRGSGPDFSYTGSPTIAAVSPSELPSRGRWEVDGAAFDGTDMMALGAGLTGASDGKTGIISCWIRPTLPAGYDIFAGATTAGGTTYRVALYRDAGTPGGINVILRNAAGTNILVALAVIGYYTLLNWVHLLIAWDLAAGTFQFYVCDNDGAPSITTNTNDNVDYTLGDWYIGKGLLGAGYDGDIAEFYFAPNQYLDISQESNRRKFIDKYGLPVSLGSTGATPTGTAPKIYFHLDDGESAANFATNRVGADNFTITGTLAASANSPSDPYP